MKATFKTQPIRGSKGTHTLMQWHGRVGNVVYYVRNGRQYVRRYAARPNAPSELERLNRIRFACAVENARIVYANARLRKPYEQLWIEHGDCRRMSLFNYLVKTMMN